MAKRRSYNDVKSQQINLKPSTYTKPSIYPFDFRIVGFIHEHTAP